MPLFEKARIEVYLPDVRHPAYPELLAHLESEFAHTFGGCTVVRGLAGSYLSRLGSVIHDQVNLLYTDTSFSCATNLAGIADYADELRDVAFRALNEEAILVVVYPVYHSRSAEVSTPAV